MRWLILPVDMPMKKINLGLWLGIGLLVLLTGLILWFFRPASQQAVAKPKPVSSSVTAVNPAVDVSQAEPNVSESVVDTRTEHSPELLARREQLYRQFAEISTGFGQGQKPELRAVSQLLAEQKVLVAARVVQKSEAISLLDFLQQVLPEMSHEIEQNKREIEGIK
ncbi:hypothetical protein [Acinetobacter sp. T63]